MITIRQLTFDLPDNADKLLTYMQLDTEKVTFGFADFFRRQQIEMEKPWVGDVRKRKFKIIRTRTGLFKMGLSTIIISGQINNIHGKEKLEIRLGLPIYSLIHVITMILFVTLSAFSLNMDLWGLTLVISICTIQILSTLVDMNKTENMFLDYLESVKATSHNNMFALWPGDK